MEYTKIPVKTHFVTPGEDFNALIEKYVLPVYQKGDFMTISEKVLAITQNRVVYRKDLNIGFWAKFLSHFASRPESGAGVGDSANMAYCIKKIGLPKTLYAAVMAGFGKLVGKKGVFYEIAGREVAGIDGFSDHIWDAYKDMGIEIPLNPKGVCDGLEEKYGIVCAVIDANDFNQEVFATSKSLDEKTVLEQIKDNPAGQLHQQTPFIIMRPVK